MQVVSKIKRDGGTQIELHGKSYHFVPNEDGDHVAIVTDPVALNRLVNEIPTGYALYGSDADKKVARPAAERQAIDPLTSDADAPVQTMFVTNDLGVKIDLNTLNREELAAFASGNLKIVVNSKWKDEIIRAKILEAIRVASLDE